VACRSILQQVRHVAVDGATRYRYSSYLHLNHMYLQHDTHHIMTHQPTITPLSLWSDLPRRIGTIVIGIPFVLILLSKCPVVFFHGVHLLCAIEYANMMLHFDWCFVLVSMGFVVTCQNSNNNDQQQQLLLLLLGFLLLFLRHVSTTPQQQQHAIQGLLFLTIPMTIWIQLATIATTRQVVALLLTCWNCDTGALLVGRMSKTIGIVSNPKWLTHISPNKSLAGIVGGILCGVATAAGFGIWKLGIGLSILAIGGDLVESAIKRQSNQKDSSALLPGHGGILDRFDSSLFAVALYYNHVQQTNSV